MEQWKSIEKAPKFFISNYGRVKNGQTGRILKSTLNRTGYPAVHLERDGYRFTQAVHILVATAFVEGRQPGLQVQPIDGDKTNTNASNLKWVTPRENLMSAYRDGRVKRLRSWAVEEDGSLTEIYDTRRTRRLRRWIVEEDGSLTEC